MYMYISYSDIQMYFMLLVIITQNRLANCNATIYNKLSFS